MEVDGRQRRAVEVAVGEVTVLDQLALPFATRFVALTEASQCRAAISDMLVRGAGSIGALAAAGAAFAWQEHVSEAARDSALAELRAARPTAIDLAHGVAAVDRAARQAEATGTDPIVAAWSAAIDHADAIAAAGEAIGRHGSAWLRAQQTDPAAPIQVLTHCNAGWPALVDWGSATAPMHRLHLDGHAVHVWVDETRPRGQGARITAWELATAGIAHTIIPDGAAATVLSNGQVDAVIVGADRIAANGDTANKLGTFPLALAAQHTDIPFIVAAPHSTWDPSAATGADIPIETRPAAEVTVVSDGQQRARWTHPGSPVHNPAFDVTPAALITAWWSPDGPWTPS